MRVRTAILPTLLAALWVCACDEVPDDALETCEESQVFAGRVKTDILFVIDDSGSMSEEQEHVRDALARFIGTLASSPIANDFQIGVTNTSVEEYVLSGGGHPIDFDTYKMGPSTDVPYPAGALVAVDPTNITTPATYGDYYYDPNPAAPNPGFYGPQILAWDAANLTTDFRNNVLVGIYGSGREQPFRAAQLALSSQLASGGENAGFLRPGARLAVIFITDEDDCSGPEDPNILSDTQCRAANVPGSSLMSVSDFASFLQGPLAGEPRDVVLAAIAGVTCSGGVCTPGCGTAFGTPDRIVSLLSMFSPARTRLASICDTTFDQALDEFATAIMSQTLPLDGAVADYRMLVVTVTRPVGTISCTVADPTKSSPGELSAAGAIYEKPQAGRPASLTFQNACALEPGDQVSVKIVCVR
jgi:hypothetical protein